MSVTYKTVVFQNTTSITDLSLSIEAPQETLVYGPKQLPPNDSVTVPIYSSNCTSTVLTVNDPDHGPVKQTFATASGCGLPSYVQSVEAQYYVGEIRGRMIASQHEDEGSKWWLHVDDNGTGSTS